MDIREKRSALIDYCEEQVDCNGCIFKEYHGCVLPGDGDPDELITEAYNKLHPPEPVEEIDEVPEVHDNVNHPSHYCREGAMECIDEMIVIFGKEAVKNFCACNAWKYRARAMYKNKEEDMRKSDWYLAKLQELMQM